MSYFLDMGIETMVAAGDHIRAIGWLHPNKPFPTGEVPPDFLVRLKEFVAQSSASAEALYFGACCGIHTCEFCDNEYGIRNFGVPAGDLLFVAPEMVVHYIEQHNYHPPIEFINAVLGSPLPESDEYQILTEPFWHLHRQAIQQIITLQNMN